MNWEKARIRCREMGGYLACITSAEENEFIVNLARKHFYSQPTCCWIGGKENDGGDFARWVSGESLQMNDYLNDESSREHYLNLRLHSGRWEDYSDTGERVGGQWFVCEWPSGDPSQENPEFARGTLAQCPNKKQLKEKIAKAQKTVNGFGQGYVIAGRVILDGEGDVRHVRAQMEILPGGYFAGPVKDLTRPVGFRMHQYAPYDLKLDGTEAANVIDVGTIHLKPLRQDELQNFKAQIVLENGGDLSQASIRLSVMNGPVNTPSNGTSPGRYRAQPIMISAQENGLVEANDFSPIQYYCIVKAPDYLKHTRPIEFSAGQALDLGTITLEKPQQIKLSYIVSKEPPFDLDKIKNTTIPAGTRWKATGDIYGWDLEFKQKQGAVLLDYSYGPCQLWDLGEGELEDFADVKSKSRGLRPNKYPASSGHIYLVNQGHWRRWILLKIDADNGPSEPNRQTAKQG